MNNPSPLVPQGSLDKTQGRARVKIAVSFVLAVHAVGLVALLLAACHQPRTADLEQTQAETANYQTPTNDPSLTPPDYASTTTTNAGTNYSQVTPVPTDVGAALTDQPTNSVYTVVSGDSPYIIAKKFNVKLQALLDANPGLNPTKMRIGQKLNIPAATVAAATAPTAASPTTASLTTPSADTYKVKSGDVLLKIAKEHGVSVKALRAANHLTTDRIRVGQTLQIPARAAGAGPSTATTTGPVGAMAAATADSAAGVAQ
jgi:LysM repeat protein